MVRYLSAKGVERDFELSIEGVLAMEEQDKSFHLVREYSSLTARMRLSSADRLCRAMGTSWAEFVEDGFTFNDLISIMGVVLPELGFSDASATRLDPPPEGA